MALCSDVKKMCKKVCCTCRLDVLPSKLYCFFMSLLLLLLLLLQLAPYFDLKGHSAMT